MAAASSASDGGQPFAETLLSAPGPLVTVTAPTATDRGFEAAGTVGYPGN